ncbi:MAG: hypothetical protein HYY23_22255 [Verrucomicrobia bacterium]|nr:hypothetical protein [Verrucomicrobiota bacterium]
MATHQARQRLPLKTLLTQRGLGPRNPGEQWNKLKCPFCGQKAASVFQAKDRVDLFKCFYAGGRRGPPCSTGGEALDEAGFLAKQLCLPRKDAWVVWLKEAGVYREPKCTDATGQHTDQPPANLPEESPGNTPDDAASENAERMPSPESDDPDARAEENDESPLPDDEAEGGGEPTETLLAGTSGLEASISQIADLPTNPAGFNEVSEETGALSEADPTERGLRALHQFHRALTLETNDLQKLQQKRGLVPEVARALGFKSNLESHRELLLALLNEFPPASLLEVGLFKLDASGAKPNAQFSGWGIIGKRKAASDGEESEFDWGWTHPILIPYFDAGGKLMHLRPHKGMAKGLRVRLYVPRGPQNLEPEKFQTVVITEGEFKAAALYAVFVHGQKSTLGVCSIPGITMSKNSDLQWELFRWLKAVGARKVVVAFDNEEKGDPRLPSYKADPRKRLQTEIWARYLARLLKSRGYDGRVATLPKEWRDENGKADWDGALARLTAGGLPLPKIREQFLKVIEEAPAPGDFRKLAVFDPKEERIIKTSVARIWYQPKLPFGGEREEKLARKFERLGRATDWLFASRARALAKQFRSVIGWYYRRVPPRLDRVWYQQLETAQEAAQAGAETEGELGRVCRDQLVFFEEYLTGAPRPVADFKVEAHFMLVKLNRQRDRMVRLSTIHGDRTELIPLDTHSLTAPRDFKEWTCNQGPFTWMTGETELGFLRHDLNQLVRGFQVYQLAHFGWHYDAKFWLAVDCAITDPQTPMEVGQMLPPDEDGIFWHGGVGYLMSETDREGESFALGRPQWHPMLGLRVEAQGRLELVENVPDDPEAIRGLFQELSFAMKQTLGGFEGFLALGAVIGFAAGPEFMEREGWFPGLWVPGARGSGKSTFAGWLMALWGFAREGGVNLPDSSKVGLQITAQQYCNLPIWFEEYQYTLDASKVDFIKRLYNRDSSMKKQGETRRKIMTNALITGEATSHDSATHQRFPQVHVSAQKRREIEQATEVSFKPWLMEHQRFFFAWGAMCCAVARRSSSRRSSNGRPGVLSRN